MKVKICGLQEPEHVKAAVLAGADYVGFVFAPSKRRITFEQAEKLALLVPGDVKRVGVFVNPSQEEIDLAVKAGRLDIIQLHGEETPEFCLKQKKPVMKAFSIKTREDIEKTAFYPVSYHLVDAPATEYKGGGGKVFDWELLQDTHQSSPLFLAGGLNADNVVQAVSTIQPYAVDVSSGVETDGIKDIDKINAFIQAAKA
ncbi:phosphoribosylanthranilate isomerase [Jeotgalibacillus proteolyticus]|uniref:N-(5'-phosphoribosyl)anthranilate isomerase n=1 Tax=Jeotgalibacillus proteolyticus TaxID=2082395 RepID=A0A2S5GFX6_9BACL|nr:phosphoribosylanthranilate isomerase [Jeotgalibacillus proteolyticus]PPA71821.1 phosphoribosylanthranilate isomerase [Jeotgalibacillus proteolyticus]